MATELILKRPVEGLGSESDIVKVKPGYARNYLIPNDFAVVATNASKKLVDQLKRTRAEREARETQEAESLAAKLNKVTLTFQMKTADDAGEKVFGSVTAQDILDRLAAQELYVEKKKLQVGRPLKDLGEHKITVHLGAGIEAKLKVVLDTQEDKDKKRKASS